MRMYKQLTWAMIFRSFILKKQRNKIITGGGECRVKEESLR